MYTYIKDGQYMEFDFELDSKYDIGTTWDEFSSGKFIKLSDEQLAFRTSNPTANMKEVFDMALTVIPEKTDAEKLVEVKAEKISAIKDYDVSTNVNTFSINNAVSTWLTPTERSSYLASITSAEVLGETSITFILGGVTAELPLATAKGLLAQVQRYADTCWIVTQTHINNVNALSTVEAVEGYDITADYPEKKNFTLS